LIATVENPDAIRAILVALAESRGLTGRAPPFAAAQTPGGGDRRLSGIADAAVAEVCSLASRGVCIPLDQRSVPVENLFDTLVVCAVPGVCGRENRGSVN